MPVFLNLLLVIALLVNLPKETVKSEIIFCNLEIPTTLKQANSSFSVVYSFEIDEEGKPSRIAKVTDRFVGQEKVTPCLSEWRFRGLPKGMKLVALFRWQHGKGWVEIQVTGGKGDFSHTIKIKDGVGY